MAVRGGDKFIAEIKKKRRQFAATPKLRIGFIDGATYPETGIRIAQVAFWNEFGATVKIPAHTTTVYRSIAKDSSFKYDGRFVKQGKSNYSTTHEVAEYTITIPARPFFRKMIADCKNDWGQALNKSYQMSGDFNKAFQITGHLIEGQLKMSIKDFTDPPNAKSTIAKKGKDNPLIDKGLMIRYIGSEVVGS